MKLFLTFFAVMLLARAPALSQQFADLAGEIRVPVPQRWQLLMEEPDEYPYTLMHEERPAQVSIFKEVIEASDGRYPSVHIFV